MSAVPRTRYEGLRRLRWIHLAPVMAFLALAAWAFASPIGAGPDDDYHLISTWCAAESDQCQPAPDPGERTVPHAFPHIVCFAHVQVESAACQDEIWANWDAGTTVTDRGNFVGEYPQVYYATMHLFAGDDVQVSALAMRLLNAAIFVGLATALAVLLPATRRTTLLWGWLVALVPLGMFLIPSNNPSGWAVTGVGTAFLALLGWFETSGQRRWALGALYLVGMIMAAGSRGDAAVYAIGATVTAMIITSERTREWMIRAIPPAVALIIPIVSVLTSGQAGVGAVGFSSDPMTSTPGTDEPLSMSSLAAYNLLMLPFLWTGVWGSWALGWLDTGMPAIVQWSATGAFLAVAFAGLGRIDWRKAISASGVLLVLIVLPVYVLTAGGDAVGDNLQPRYLLPLIVLFALVLTTMPAGASLRFTRVQTFAILGALALANFVAMQVNIRRYVTGTDRPGLNLDSGAEWWWTGLPIGPTAMWIVGSLAFAGLLAVLWPELRRPNPIVTSKTDVSRLST